MNTFCFCWNACPREPARKAVCLGAMTCNCYAGELLPATALLFTGVQKYLTLTTFMRKSPALFRAWTFSVPWMRKGFRLRNLFCCLHLATHVTYTVCGYLPVLCTKVLNEPIFRTWACTQLLNEPDPLHPLYPNQYKNQTQ